MKIHLYEAADALPGEDELLKRIERLHKRDDKPVVATIGIKNARDQVRLIVLAYTEAEADGVLTLFDQRNFEDELHFMTEVSDEDGGIEVTQQDVEHPTFDHLLKPIEG